MTSSEQGHGKQTKSEMKPEHLESLAPVNGPVSKRRSMAAYLSARVDCGSAHNSGAILQSALGGSENRSKRSRDSVVCPRFTIPLSTSRANESKGMEVPEDA
jgi:hypothetical protein